MLNCRGPVLRQEVALVPSPGDGSVLSRLQPPPALWQGGSGQLSARLRFHFCFMQPDVLNFCFSKMSEIARCETRTSFPRHALAAAARAIRMSG